MNANINAYGYQGQYGLENAKDELRVFKKKYDRLPKVNEFGVRDNL